MKPILNKFIYLLIGCIVLIFSFLIFIKNENIEKMNIDEKYNKIKYENEWYHFNFELNNRIEGIHIGDFIFENSEKKINRASEFVQNRPILFFRFSDINCNTCYEEEIKIINEIFENNTNFIQILCSYEIRREFLAFKKLNSSNVEIFSISSAFDDKFGINMPYYFLLHNNMKISHIYIPDKMHPESSRKYLQRMKRIIEE